MNCLLSHTRERRENMACQKILIAEVWPNELVHGGFCILTNNDHFVPGCSRQPAPQEGPPKQL